MTLSPAPLTSTRFDRLAHETVGVLALALVHFATAVSFARVFDGWEFLPSLIIMILAAHTLSALARHLNVPFTLALPALTFLVYFLVGHLALASTLRYGLPLSATWDSLSTQVSDSWNLLGEIVPPVSQDSGFGLVALISLGLAVVLADAFAFRFAGRVEAFVPSTVIFVVVAAVGIDRQRVALSAVWIGTVLAAVTVLRARDRSLSFLSRSSAFGYRPALTLLRLCFSGVVLAIAIGFGASLAGPILPGANQEAWLTARQTGTGRVLEPLVDVRRRLNNPTDEVLFTVAAERSAYWRLTSLPVFDGDTWTVPSTLINDAGSQLATPLDGSISNLDVTSNVQRLSITNLSGTLLPVSYEPVQLRAASRSLFYELETGSLVVGGDGLSPNDSYELVSSIVSPRPELLSTTSATSPPSLESIDTSYLAVPDNDEVAELRRIVSGIVNPADSPYAIALGLQSFFRDTFTYSLDVPSQLNGEATLAFLERRTGYCEQFASTFALFARLVGIPSRVAVGFTPGAVVDEVNGRNVFEVRSQHAHAWPEVWFDGIGWVLFEPTPGRGAPNAGYTNVPEQQDETTPIPSPENSAPTTTAPPLPLEDPTSPTTQPSTDLNNGAGASTDGESFLNWWRGLLLLALGLTTWSVAIPRLVRWSSRRKLTGTILDSWRRVVALYEFQRGPFNRSLSPAEIAATATSRLWDDDPYIVQLAQVVTETLYSGRVMDLQEQQLWINQTEQYLRDRISRLTFGARLRMRFDPLTIYRMTGAQRLVSDV